jgi:hypothetical protein
MPLWMRARRRPLRFKFCGSNGDPIRAFRVGVAYAHDLSESWARRKMHGTPVAGYYHPVTSESAQLSGLVAAYNFTCAFWARAFTGLPLAGSRKLNSGPSSRTTPRSRLSSPPGRWRPLGHGEQRSPCASLRAATGLKPPGRILGWLQSRLRSANQQAMERQASRFSRLRAPAAWQRRSRRNGR